MPLDDIVGHHEISTCLTLFARGMDDRDWEAITRILSEDATADFGEGLIEGSAAILATYRRYLDACGPTQHLLGNLLVDIRGDQAESRCYVSDMHIGAGQRAHLTFCTLGDYHDRWLKQEDKWRLVHRVKYNRGFIGSRDIFDRP